MNTDGTTKVYASALDDSESSKGSDSSMEEDDLSQIGEGLRDTLCTVCGTALEEPIVQCDTCGHFFHLECWDYCGVCPAIGCGCKVNRTVITRSTHLIPVKDDSPAIFIGDDEGVASHRTLFQTLIRYYCLPADIAVNGSLYAITNDDSYLSDGSVERFMSPSIFYKALRTFLLVSVFSGFYYLAQTSFMPEAVILSFLYYLSSAMVGFGNFPESSPGSGSEGCQREADDNGITIISSDDDEDVRLLK